MARKEEASITRLLPRLRDKSITEIIIVTLSEATSYFEIMRLKDDLARAAIKSDTFVINNVTAAIKTTDNVLAQCGTAEVTWIERIANEIPTVYIAEHKM